MNMVEHEKEESTLANDGVSQKVANPPHSRLNGIRNASLARSMSPLARPAGPQELLVRAQFPRESLLDLRFHPTSPPNGPAGRSRTIIAV